MSLFSSTGVSADVPNHPVDYVLGRDGGVSPHTWVADTLLTEQSFHSQPLLHKRTFFFTNSRMLRVFLCCFDISRNDVKL